MARKWIPVCIGALLLIIVIACVAGGCGKIVEGVSEEDCYNQVGQCGDACCNGSECYAACHACCQQKVLNCGPSGSPITDADIQECKNWTAAQAPRVREGVDPCAGGHRYQC